MWTMARFFLYASYFTIFGVLFGFKNFGKMVAVDNVVNGLFGAPAERPVVASCLGSRCPDALPRPSVLSICGRAQSGLTVKSMLLTR